MEKFNWDTEFDTATEKMIITFSERLKVEYYRNTGIIAVFKDGDMLIHFDLNQEDEPLRDTNKFIAFLEGVASEAKRLSRFSES